MHTHAEDVSVALCRFVLYGRIRPSHPTQETRSEAMLKAGAFAKKKRREKQYRLQLTQQQLLQDRLVRDQLLEAAASKEREFVRLSGEVVEGNICRHRTCD